jgi:phage terminase large subunit GpA-like protein
VVLLAGGVDVQEDRLELVVRGWGAGMRSWGVSREIFLGDPKIPYGRPGSPWNPLEEARKRTRQREGSGSLSVAVMCVDMGYAPDEVAVYCRARWRQRVYPVRGSSEPGQPIVSRRPSRNNKHRLPMFWVGTDTAKDTIAKRLLIVGTDSAELPPFAMTWNLDDAAGFDTDYFQQLTGERRVPVKRDGRTRWVWQEIRGERHEALDCEVYALAAFALAKLPAEKLEIMAAALTEAAQAPVDSTETVTPPPPPKSRPRRKGKGWAFRV